MPNLRLRTRGYRAFAAAVLVAFFVATLGGMFDPPPNVPDSGKGWGWVVLAVLGLLMWRTTRIGLALDGDQLLVRNWFRTRRVRAEQVAEVVVRPYDGMLTRGSKYNRLLCLTLAVTNGAPVTAWGLVGGRNAIQGLARTLSERLDVPVRTLNKWDQH